MAIDIRNINEITFTQSFRGYNTEEVDEFLDRLYDEAIENNKEIDALKKKLAALESGAPVAAPADDGMSQEEAYAIIANAQEEADRIVENARQKAHSLIESAESMSEQTKAAQPAPAQSGGMDALAVAKLKGALRELYEKQMSILDGAASAPAEAAEPAPEPAQKADEAPSVAFSGLTRQMPRKMPAERDILGEINSIGISGHKPSIKSEEVSIEIDVPDVTPAPNYHEEEENSGLAFSFAEHDEHDAPQEETAPEPVPSFEQNQPEDPDDIIAQILRDNNRN